MIADESYPSADDHDQEVAHMCEVADEVRRQHNGGTGRAGRHQGLHEVPSGDRVQLASGSSRMSSLRFLADREPSVSCAG